MSPRARGLLLGLGALSCLVAPVLTLAGVQTPVRVVAAVVLFGLAPGLAALPVDPRRAAPVELALIVGTSLAVSALGAQAMLWLGAWSPGGGACVLGGACLAAMAFRLRWREPVL